jgi:endonuclease/exonuclease/phosphatase family metal-dependent hydrolase
MRLSSPVSAKCVHYTDVRPFSRRAKVSDPRPERQFQGTASRLARRHPRETLLLLVALGIVIVGFIAWSRWFKPKEVPPVIGDGKPATVLFCSWNVENFYDDHHDANVRDEIEEWFGNDPAAFRTKVDHLAEGLLKMNDGVGPDIACLCEVESERCMEALRDAINAKLDAAGLGERKYTHILFKLDNSGRHFAPAILTRIDVTADRTRKLGNRANGRILEGHLHHNGYELIVIVAHWTSRVTDDKDDGHRRMSYANDCYGRVNSILKQDPDADVVVCGDFNDEFRDASIQKGLRATSNIEDVRNSLDEPRLFDLFGNWRGDPAGTIYHEKNLFVFDHICVTRGLLDDKGWSCDPKSAKIFAPKEFRSKNGQPLRFGNKNWRGERGYSDHFPVMAQFSVAEAIK